MRDGFWTFLGSVLAAGVLLAGCATPAPKNLTPQADFSSVRKDLKGIGSKISGAQTDVRVGLGFSRAGNAAEAVTPLEKADSQLSDALGRVKEGNEHLKEVETAALKQKTSSDKALAASAKKIQQLEEQYFRTLRLWLSSFAGIFILGGILSIVARFYIGFLAGGKAGAALLATGLTLAFFAFYLHLIVFWIGVILGATALGSGAYFLVKLFTHNPEQSGNTRND
jgi:hypothetical protein